MKNTLGKVIKNTLGKVIKLCRNPPWLINLNDSLQDGFTQFFSGSMVTESNFLRNKIRAQSIILMMRCGGFWSFRTDATCAGLIVCKAASASSKAGLATSSFFSADCLSTYVSKKRASHKVSVSPSFFPVKVLLPRDRLISPARSRFFFQTNYDLFYDKDCK